MAVVAAVVVAAVVVAAVVVLAAVQVAVVVVAAVTVAVVVGYRYYNNRRRIGALVAVSVAVAAQKNICINEPLSPQQSCWHAT